MKLVRLQSRRYNSTPIIYKVIKVKEKTLPEQGFFAISRLVGYN